MKKIKRHYTRSTAAICLNFSSIPSENISNDTKEILCKVLKDINLVKGTRYEVVENKDLQLLEIREIGLK